MFATNPVPNVVNGSLWSIPFEFWCYIGVGLLGITGLIRRNYLIVAILAAVLLGRAVLDLLGRRPGGGVIEAVIGFPYLWFVILPSFLLGMVAYAFGGSIPRSRVLLAALAAAGVAGAHINQHLAHLIVAPALAYATFYLAFSDSVRFHGAARWGDFSYGTYLYAFPIQQMLYASYGLEMRLQEYILWSLALSLLAGVLSWHVVERWFLPSKEKLPPIDRAAALVAP